MRPLLTNPVAICHTDLLAATPTPYTRPPSSGSDAQDSVGDRWRK
jgi:hypothetical protein